MSSCWDASNWTTWGFKLHHHCIRNKSVYLKYHLNIFKNFSSWNFIFWSVTQFRLLRSYHRLREKYCFRILSNSLRICSLKKITEYASVISGFRCGEAENNPEEGIYQLSTHLLYVYCLKLLAIHIFINSVLGSTTLG